MIDPALREALSNPRRYPGFWFALSAFVFLVIATFLRLPLYIVIGYVPAVTFITLCLGVFIHVIVKELRTGVAGLRTGIVRREDLPIAYWLIIFIQSLIACAFAVLLVAVIVGWAVGLPFRPPLKQP